MASFIKTRFMQLSNPVRAGIAIALAGGGYYSALLWSESRQESKRKAEHIIQEKIDKDPIFHLFANIDIAMNATLIKTLEKRWQKNPERVRHFLKTNLMGAFFRNSSFYGFSTDALLWAKHKQAFDVSDVTKEMQSRPCLSCFNPHKTAQLLHVFPDFVHPRAMYKLLDNESSFLALPGCQTKEPFVHRQYLGIFEKDPRDTANSKAYFVQHVVRYLVCYAKYVPFLDEIFDTHPDILEAYIARGVSDGKLVDGATVPFYINDAERRYQQRQKAQLVIKSTV